MYGSVLLARPHPLPISRMKPFLVECSLAPVQLQNINEIDRMAKYASGAIIAVGAASTLDLTLSEAFARIRRATPNLPLIFASLFDAEHAARAIRTLPTALGLEAPVMALEDYDGRTPSFVHLSIFDLDDPIRRRMAADVVRRHFKAHRSAADRKISAPL